MGPSSRGARFGGFTTVAIAWTLVVGSLAGGVAADTPTWTPTYSYGFSDLGYTGNVPPGPAKIPGLHGVQVAQISASSDHVLVLSTSGKIFAWGANNFGELGNGTMYDSYTPTPVSLPAGASRVVKVAAGGFYSIAVTATGQVYSWGAFQGLGTGSTTNALVPTAVPLPNNYHAVDVSADPEGTEVSVITANGQVLSWGQSVPGFKGNGKGTGQYLKPRELLLPTGFTATSVVIREAAQIVLGSVAGGSEVLGYGVSYLDGTDSARSVTPVVAQFPAGAAPVSSIAALYGESYALTASGQLYSWGSGDIGLNGTGTDTEEIEPTLVALPAGTVVTALTTGNSTVWGHTLALTTTGQVFGWGNNEFQTINPGPSDVIDTPVQVSDLPAGDITHLTASDYATYLTITKPAS